MKSTPLLVALLSLPFAAPAEAARVTPAGVTASSHHPEQGGVSYVPTHAVDGKLGTAWIEGEEGSGLGSWLELDLGEEREVARLRVWAGLWHSGDFWRRANRPGELEVRWSDGTSQRFRLDDEMKPQELVLDSPKRTSSVRLRVISVHTGSTWFDTAISQVQVFDTSADDHAPVRAVTASSHLPADSDASYEPDNVINGLTDSVWCEGSDGDGSGEWLEFQFAGSQRVSQLQLVNGIGSSMQVWMNANRATSAQLTFADGSTHDISIRNVLLPQTISFPARTTDRVRLTITGVAKGREFNDLCLAEAYFRP